MKLQRSWIYLGVVLLIFLAACGPATATPAGSVQNGPIPAPTVVSAQAQGPLPLGAKPLLCTPPAVSIDQVTPVCVSQTKGVGGISFVEHVSDPASAFAFIHGDITSQTCGWDQKADFETLTCKGPPNAQFQYEVCTHCGTEVATVPSYSYTCSTGYVKDGKGGCTPSDLKQYYGACPPGSHYMNVTQNCVDDATEKPVAVCPPGFTGQYLPDRHVCLDVQAFPVAYSCQTFQFKLGACVALNPALVAVKVVPFCQTGGANIGGANITYPAGTTLVVDTKGNHLQSCTPGGTQPDGTQLFTCFGTAGNTFNVQLCTDPSTCTTYPASLGTCPVKKNKPGPACDPTITRCP
jgi:hypothetical protein